MPVTFSPQHGAMVPPGHAVQLSVVGQDVPQTTDDKPTCAACVPQKPELNVDPVVSGGIGTPISVAVTLPLIE
jgi:hypothetical protein